MPNFPMLSIRHLTVRYGDRVAVAELSLDVARGEILGLLGPNGSGKSSTIAAIAGLLRLVSGEIRLDGLTRAERPDAYHRRFGLVPQEFALYEELSVIDNARFFGGLYGTGGRDRAAEVLDFVQLGDRARVRVGHLSGGMKRRLNLACALMHDPDVLLLDEPTAGVDVPSRDTLFALLRELRERGMAIVYTTHHLEEVEPLCDRLAVMKQGCLVASGTLAELSGLTDASCRVSARLPEALSRIDECALRSHMSPEVALSTCGHELTIIAPDAAAMRRAVRALALSGVPFDELAAGRPTCEQIYLSLTGEGASCDPALPASDAWPARIGGSSWPTAAGRRSA